jgi:Subtilase family
MTARTLRSALFVAVGLAVGVPNIALGDEVVPGLELRVGTIATPAKQGLAALAGAPSAGKHFVIQLDGPTTPERTDALRAAGIKVKDYLPINAYIVTLDNAKPEAVAGITFVRWFDEYQNGWKLDPEIGKRPYQTTARQNLVARGRDAFEVTIFTGSDAGAAAKGVFAIPGAEILREESQGDQQVLAVVMNLADVAKLAQIPEVQYVEPAWDVTPRNSTTRWIIQTNTLNQTPLWNQGLRGEGQILGHSDGKVNVSHCSFRDATNPVGPLHRKIVAYNTTQGYDLHGTHTAGTAVGQDIAGGTGDTRGMAYNAKLVFDDIPAFSDAGMYALLQQHHNQGARMHTNSWGNDGTTTYDGLCRGIDRYCYDFEEGMVFFAVTNLSALKNPENAKNLVAVGATQDTPNQGNHCTGGTGPTVDGRRKPEVYAPGCNTLSSSGSGSVCTTSGLTGTSMACPAVTGGSMLLRQYFMDGFYPTGAPVVANKFTPSGALVKAMLINSSQNMTGPAGYPSNQEGWGRMLMDEAVFFTGDNRQLIVKDVFNADGLTTGQNFEQTFKVNGSASQLRVTMVFTEPAATAGAGAPVINNLDLEVIAPDGITVYKGNVFTAGVSTPGGAFDTKNNVEQVHLTNPTLGTWKYRVTGQSVSAQGKGKQGYSVVVTGIVAPDSPPPSCYPDCDTDGVLSIDDFICYQTFFALSDPYADCDADGVLSIDDFICFQTYFAIGC